MEGVGKKMLCVFLLIGRKKLWSGIKVLFAVFKMECTCLWAWNMDPGKNKAAIEA